MYMYQIKWCMAISDQTYRTCRLYTHESTQFACSAKIVPTTEIILTGHFDFDVENFVKITTVYGCQPICYFCAAKIGLNHSKIRGHEMKSCTLLSKNWSVFV